MTLFANNTMKASRIQGSAMHHYTNITSNSPFPSQLRPCLVGPLDLLQSIAELTATHHRESPARLDDGDISPCQYRNISTAKFLINQLSNHSPNLLHRRGARTITSRS